MFGMMSERFGWTPAQIGELTYPQFCGYLRYIKKRPFPIVAMSDLPKDD